MRVSPCITAAGHRKGSDLLLGLCAPGPWLTPRGRLCDCCWTERPGDWISNPTVLVGHGLRLFASGAPVVPSCPIFRDGWSRRSGHLPGRVWDRAWPDMAAPLTQQASCPRLIGHIFLHGIYVFIKFYGFKTTKKTPYSLFFKWLILKMALLIFKVISLFFVFVGY